jgi:hypothetical protein
VFYITRIKYQALHPGSVTFGFGYGRQARLRLCAEREVAYSTQCCADAILTATREQRSQEERFSFHPYYLDLAYGIIDDRAVGFQSADLGQMPSDLQIRFLRYLQKGVEQGRAFS